MMRRNWLPAFACVPTKFHPPIALGHLAAPLGTVQDHVRYSELAALPCRVELPAGDCAAALKAVDVSKSLWLVRDLVWEERVLDALASVACVPKKLAAGTMTGGLCYFLASTLLHGSHPTPGMIQPETLHTAHLGLSEIHAAGFLHGDLRAHWCRTSAAPTAAGS